jgi:hypothetical protein
MKTIAFSCLSLIELNNQFIDFKIENDIEIIEIILNKFEGTNEMIVIYK